jgi:hypothetical protein
VRAIVGGAVAAWFVACPGIARADETFTVAYEAALGCPEKASFVDQIQRRTRRVRPAGPGEQPTHVLSVRLDPPKKAKTHGHLGLTSGTRSSERGVEGASCDEAASALALIAALAIDPLADTRPVAVLPELGAATGAVGAARVAPSTPVDEPLHVGRYFDGTWSIEDDAKPAWPLWFSIPREPDGGRALAFGAGGSFTTLVGPAPSPLVGGAGWLELFSTRGLRWSSRVWIAYATVASPDALPEGELRHRLFLARLEGCVPGYPALDWLTLYPCGSAAGGSLWGELSRTVLGADTSKEGASPWMSLGLAGRATARFGGPLVADLRLGLEVPLVRGSFLGSGDAELSTPAPAAFDGALGLGLAF